MQLPKLSIHVLCCKLFTAPGFADFYLLYATQYTAANGKDLYF